jgi:ATP-dependent DNA helicase RecG
MSSLDEVKLADYLMRLKSGKPNLARLDDEKIYELISISRNKIPTLSSEMLFGLYPQAFFPQLSIIAVCVQGTQIGDKGDDGERFIDNKRIEGTIPEMLEDAIRFVQKNTRTKTIIDPITAKRTDKPDYPVKAVREAILNALVHRDYSIHTEGMPIQIMVFSDRLEIKNPGGLYGRITLDALGKTQPDTRNPVLATALELMGVTENRYSGIPTIRNELEQHGLPQPEFAVIRGEFCVTFHLKEEAKMQENNADKPTLEQFCKTPRSRKEITEFLGIRSATYAINKYVIPLVEQGKLFMEIPDKPTSRNQRFYSK